MQTTATVTAADITFENVFRLHDGCQVIAVESYKYEGHWKIFTSTMDRSGFSPSEQVAIAIEVGATEIELRIRCKGDGRIIYPDFPIHDLLNQ